MQITEKIIAQMGESWVEVFRPFIESEQWDHIFNTLKGLSKSGKTIIPDSSSLFKSFQLLPRHKMRVLVLLQCPYATQRDMGGKKVNIASGVPMSCENITPYLQPSLYHWHSAIEKTYGFDPESEQRCDISYLLKEEGVMLLNTALTVEMDKVDSHALLWSLFTQYMLEEIVSKIMCGLPIIMMGTQAQKYEKYINPMCHHILKVEHPAAAAYANREWKYNDMFEWTNKILRANNGQEVRWTRKKGESKKEDNQLPQWVTEPMYKGEDLHDLPWEK